LKNRLINRIRIKPVLISISKLLLPFLFLWWLISSERLDISAAIPLFNNKDSLFVVVAGVITTCAALVLLGIRFRLIVELGNVSISLAQSTALTSIGAMLSTVFWGHAGGDAARILALCRGPFKNDKAVAVVVVLLDRLIGIFSLLLLGTLALVGAIVTDDLPLNSPILFIFPSIVVFVIAGVTLLWVEGLVRKIPIIGDLLDRMPQKIQDTASIFPRLLRHRRSLALSILLSVGSHSLLCFTFIFAGHIIGWDSLRLTQQFLLNPIAMLMNAVPVVSGGLGIAESAFSFLYELIGYENGALVGLLGRIQQYVAYILAGGLSLLAYSRLFRRNTENGGD
jgi:uncharacterized protein (TIRG00374 family)